MLYLLATHPDSRARLLADRSDLLLGVAPERGRTNHQREIQPGDTLVLYTDGLIERRDEDLDVSLARLADSLAGAHTRSLDELAATIVATRPGDNADDVALLLVRIAG